MKYNTKHLAYTLKLLHIRIVQHLHTVLIGDFGGTKNFPKLHKVNIRIRSTYMVTHNWQNTTQCRFMLTVDTKRSIGMWLWFPVIITVIIIYPLDCSQIGGIPPIEKKIAHARRSIETPTLTYPRAHAPWSLIWTYSMYLNAWLGAFWRFSSRWTSSPNGPKWQMHVYCR